MLVWSMTFAVSWYVARCFLVKREWLAAPVTAFSRTSGVCLMILAANCWSASLSRFCSWHSTVCVPLNAACTQPWCLNSHSRRSSKQDAVCLQRCQDLEFVRDHLTIEWRAWAYFHFADVGLKHNICCCISWDVARCFLVKREWLAAPVTAFSRTSGVCLMILAANC